MLYNPYFNLGQMNPMIVSSARGDVNGDGIPDNVYLTGVKTIDSPFIQKITLVIQDGRTGIVNYVPLESDAGFNPTLFLGDFTGDGVKDILISIASGGSGGIMFYYIYSYVCNSPKLIFDYNVFNEAYQYHVIYKDYYKVEVTNVTEGIKYIIDISTREQDYLNEIYDTEGKLKSPIKGFVNPLSGLYPIDFDSDGVYELLAYQRISGRFAADALGYVLTTLKWDGRKFALVNQSVAIWGTEI
ncbi:MAG: VCBS repeat-containing protein [Clostridiaceae bacterium]|nr:VCBS repeat-containing protein [Clostridiaceae bacterium]